MYYFSHTHGYNSIYNDPKFYGIFLYSKLRNPSYFLKWNNRNYNEDFMKKKAY
jgi:hypothetical protein